MGNLVSLLGGVGKDKAQWDSVVGGREERGGQLLHISAPERYYWMEKNPRSSLLAVCDGCGHVYYGM